MNSIKNKVKADPLNPELHFEYAMEAHKHSRHFLAFAELKTASFLKGDESLIKEFGELFYESLPELKFLKHNQYFRFNTLSSAILSKAKNNDFSVLDVGGGNGTLAAFLPEASYCLAEPRLNGISGAALPFSEKSFDYVVACHVLEHIPISERHIFLDSLLNTSKKGVILLNPFHSEEVNAEDRLKFHIDILDAPWAKEHLECSLPKIADIEDYAESRDLDYSIKASGTMTTSMAFVYIDYFASLTEKSDDLLKLYSFFNENYTHILDSEKCPSAYLICLSHK